MIYKCLIIALECTGIFTFKIWGIIMNDMFVKELIKKTSEQFSFVLTKENELTYELLSAYNQASKDIRKDIAMAVIVEDKGIYLDPGIIAFQDFSQLHNFIYDQVKEKYDALFREVYHHYRQDTISKGIFAFSKNWLSEQIFNLLNKFNDLLKKLSGKYLNIEEMKTLTNLISDENSYWKGVSAFNLNQAKIIGQVEELIIKRSQRYKIVAIFDNATCAPCKMISGTTFEIESAYKILEYRVNASIDDLYANFPTEKDIEIYSDLSKSPYALPPFHPFCRCSVVAVA